MPARKYPAHTCEQAAELRERGMSFGAIGRQLGMSSGAVYWHCLRLGADVPDGHAKPLAPRGPDVVRRADHVVRRFGPDEDARLVEMDLAGAGVSEIARALGRKHNSVIGRLMTLAREQARAEARRGVA